MDRQLTEISGSYDFLLDLTPINSAAGAGQSSSAAAAWPSPKFRYRPLAVSPGELKRALYSINIGRIEDPSLEDLFREKQLEMDHQLTMLQCRGTPQFKDASRLLYGSVDAGLLAMARPVHRSGASKREAAIPREPMRAARWTATTSSPRPTGRSTRIAALCPRLQRHRRAA